MGSVDLDLDRIEQRGRGATSAQTAEIMGCSVGAVKSQVSVGLGRLRERMGSDVDLLLAGEEGVTS